MTAGGKHTQTFPLRRLCVEVDSESGQARGLARYLKCGQAVGCTVALEAAQWADPLGRLSARDVRYHPMCLLKFYRLADQWLEDQSGPIPALELATAAPDSATCEEAALQLAVDKCAAVLGSGAAVWAATIYEVYTDAGGAGHHQKMRRFADAVLARLNGATHRLTTERGKLLFYSTNSVGALLAGAADDAALGQLPAESTAAAGSTLRVLNTHQFMGISAAQRMHLLARDRWDTGCVGDYPPDSTYLNSGAVGQYVGNELDMICQTLVGGIGSLYRNPDAKLTAHEKQKQRVAQTVSQMIVHGANVDRNLRVGKLAPPALYAVAMAARSNDTNLLPMLANVGVSVTDNEARSLEYTWAAQTRVAGVKGATQGATGRVALGRDNIDAKQTPGLHSSPGFHDGMTAMYVEVPEGFTPARMPAHNKVTVCPEERPPPNKLYLKKPKPWPLTSPDIGPHASFADGRGPAALARLKLFLRAHALAAEDGEQYENFTVAYKSCEASAGRKNPVVHEARITEPIGGSATNDTYNFRYLEDAVAQLDELDQHDAILCVDGGDYDHICRLIWEHVEFGSRLFLEPGGLHLGMLIQKLLGRVGGQHDGYREWWLLADIVGQEEVDKVNDGKLYTKARRIHSCSYIVVTQKLMARFVAEHPDIPASNRDKVVAALTGTGKLALPSAMVTGTRITLEDLNRDFEAWRVERCKLSAQTEQLFLMLDLQELGMLSTLNYQSEDMEECGEGSVQVLYEVVTALLPFCHGWNCHKYARILSVFALMLEQCWKTHPGVWEDYHRDGNISMRRKKTRIPRDRVMEEQVIKQAKRALDAFKERDSKGATAWAASIAAKTSFLNAARDLFGLPDDTPQESYTRSGEHEMLRKLSDAWDSLDDPLALPTGAAGSTIVKTSRWNFVTGTLADPGSGVANSGMFAIGLEQSVAYMSELRTTVGQPGLNVDKGYFRKMTRNPMPLPLPATKGAAGKKPSSAKETMNVLHAAIVRWELIPGTKMSLPDLLSWPLTPFPLMTADASGRPLLEANKSSLTATLKKDATPFENTQAKVFEGGNGPLPLRVQRTRTAAALDGGQTFVRQAFKNQSTFGALVRDVKDNVVQMGRSLDAGTVYFLGELYPPPEEDTKASTGDKRATNKTVPSFAQIGMDTKIGTKVAALDTLRSRETKIKLNKLLAEEFVKDTSGTLKGFLGKPGSSVVTLILNQAHRYTLNANGGIVREVLDALASNLPEADHRFGLVARYHHDRVVASDWEKVEPSHYLFDPDQHVWLSVEAGLQTHIRPMPTQVLINVTEDADNTVGLLSQSSGLTGLAIGVMYGKGDARATVDLHNMVDRLPPGLAAMVQPLHILSGDDSNSKFKGIGKVKWLTALRSAFLDKGDGAPQALLSLGKTDFTEDDAFGGDIDMRCAFEAMSLALRQLLLRLLKALDLEGVLTLNDARHWQFTTKGKSDLGDLTLTDEQWRWHVLRANYLCHVWHCGSVVPALHVPSPIGRGWRKGEDGRLVLVWQDGEVLPPALRETYACKTCKTGCKKGACKCHKGKRKCTVLCGCTNCENR